MLLCFQVSWICPSPSPTSLSPHSFSPSLVISPSPFLKYIPLFLLHPLFWSSSPSPFWPGPLTFSPSFFFISSFSSYYRSFLLTPLPSFLRFRFIPLPRRMHRWAVWRGRELLMQVNKWSTTRSCLLTCVLEIHFSSFPYLRVLFLTCNVVRTSSAFVHFLCEWGGKVLAWWSEGGRREGEKKTEGREGWRDKKEDTRRVSVEKLRVNWGMKVWWKQKKIRLR